MIINHNMNAMNAHRNMSMNTVNSGKSMEKLSSGLRINRAGDDAAGLAISEKMRGQIRGLDQASRNSQDGISMIQTAEGALNETHSILQRMKELATQAANDTNTKDDRGQIQNEMNQLTSEMNRIGNTTEFNTQKLLDGSKNLTEAKAAMAAGTKVEGKIKVTSEAIQATTTSAALANGVEIHDGKAGKATGTKAYTTAGAAGTVGADIAADSNELTLTIDGTQKTIALATKNYDGSATNTLNDMLTDINTKINTAFGTTGKAYATVNGEGKIEFASQTKGTSSSVTIDGGNALTHLLATPATEKISTQGGVAANNTLDIKLGSSAATTITLDNKNYKDANELVSALNTKLTGTALDGKVTVKADGNSLVLTGSNKEEVSVSGGAAQNVLGFSNAKTTKAQDVNNTLAMKVDGEAISFTMANGEFDLNEVAGMLQNKINAATTTAKDVTVTVKDGALSIESGSKGATSKVEVTANELSKSLGLTADTTTAKTAIGEDGKDASITLQIGANQGQAFSMSISDMRSKALGVAGDTGAAAKIADAKFTATKGVTNGTDNVSAEAALDISDHKSATAAIKVLDDAINTVSTERSKLGAYQNRLEHTIANLGTSSENLTAAESRVRDVDMAKEMMTFSKNNILTQAAQAMLAQAKSQPEGVLQLLR